MEYYNEDKNSDKYVSKEATDLMPISLAFKDKLLDETKAHEPTMVISDLANYLNAFSEIYSTANSVLGKKEVNVAIYFKGYKKGSEWFDLNIVAEKVTKLVQDNNVIKELGGFLETVKDVKDVWDYTKYCINFFKQYGKDIKFSKDEDGNFFTDKQGSKVYVENKHLDLLKNKHFKKALKSLMQFLKESDDRTICLYSINKEPDVEVTTKDYANFDFEDSEIDIEYDIVPIMRVTMEVITISSEISQPWYFRMVNCSDDSQKQLFPKEGKFHAHITDDEFLAKVATGKYTWKAKEFIYGNIRAEIPEKNNSKLKRKYTLTRFIETIDTDVNLKLPVNTNE